MRMKTSLLGGAALAGAIALVATGASAQDMTYRWSGAPRFANDDAYFKVRGRFLMDAVFTSVDRQTGADYHLRQVRGRQAFLGVEGAINSQFAYKFEGGVVNGGAWSWDDAVIEWKASETTSVLAGNIKAAGLENLTSTRFTTFMDRGPFGDIGPDSYLLSAVVKHGGPNWSVTGAIQGNSLNSGDAANGIAAARPGQPPSTKERVGGTIRAHYVPINSDTDKVHIAGFARKRNNGTEAAFNYNPRTNAAYGANTGAGFVTSGNIGDSDTTYGVEAAWVHNSWSIQGEYANIDIKRFQSAGTAGKDPKVEVGYVFASFWPTGETRNYNVTGGEFGRPKILNPVTAGGLGGVELALRYDFADLEDIYKTANAGAPRTAAATAGKYTAWTAGVNYYPFAYVRVQANYTSGKNEMPVANTDVDFDQFQMRVQLDF